MQPMQFCTTTSTTGPVEHPGRMYDLTLPINPGFAVDSLTMDAVTQNAGITWSIFDPDGAQFAADLQSFIQSRMSGSTVTVTNPNAGSTQVCGAALPMQIHIECLRLDEDPPDLVELVYNAGADLIQNPAYNESPPLSPPAPQGNYGFRLLSRQDDPGPFPGNPPANDALCTSVANRGWETNDIGRTFEIWGQDVSQGQSTTPTPRGTPVQEITSDGPPPGGRSTIWQTFNVTTPGTFNIRLVHGARDPGEQHIISLSTGDTNDVQVGDIINDVTTPPSVTSSGGPNPWTTFSQNLPLNTGLYTLALSTTNPAGGARGGLFTDMRVFIDRPNTRATATNDDDTCTVTTDETQTTTLCEFWTPSCDGGAIADWTNAETGVTLTNAAFWAQTPKPSCCGTEAAEAPGGNGVQSNLIVSDIVCATVNGVRSNVVREVLFDPSGGQLEVAFIGEDGVRFTPDDWTPGECVTSISDLILCDRQPDGSTISFLRKYVQTWSQDIGAQIIAIRDFTINNPSSTYTVTGTVVTCASTVDTGQSVVLCDSGNSNVQFIRNYHRTGDVVTGTDDTTLDGTTPYVVVGPATVCVTDIFTTTGLCLADGTPIGIVNRRTPAGNVVQDGWINLLTGTFSAGVPPVGTQACGQNLNIQTSDVLCDMDTGTGTVNALVLIQYDYNPDGSIASTTIINATTGAPYTPVGTVTVCPTDTAVPDNDMQVLCDRQGDGSLVPFVRDYTRGVTGTIGGFTDYTLAGGSYTVTGTVQSCIPRDVESLVLCADNGAFIRTYTYTQSGAVSSFADSSLAGGAFTPTGTVRNCTGARDTEVTTLCDLAGGNSVPFLRRQTFDETGAVVATVDTTPGGAPYVVLGPVAACTAIDTEPQVLCDVSAGGVVTPFLRRYSYAASGLLVGTNDTTLNGSTGYTVTGTVGACPQRDTESVILCDSAVTPNRFIRTYTYGATGAVTGFTDATLAGGAFTPTGAVGVCATTVQTDTDFVEEVLCDSNGTAFIRLFRFNSTTGALISTTNTTLAGGAFTPVGAVGLCSDCCPAVVGNGCTNTGSGFYTAIRLTNGTISLVDSVTGATVLQANIVACASDDVVKTLTAQARVLTNATPWTPGGDVAGTLTSLTVTGTDGLWDMVDANGTALTGLPAGLTLTWSAEDDNTLTGPTSVTPQSGATVVANWTQR